MEMHEGMPEPDALRALAPAVTLSLVVSLDGQLRGPDGSSRSISGPEDLLWLRTLRATADTVVVGAATAEHEQYGQIRAGAEFREFRMRHGLPEHPTMVVLRRMDDVALLRSAWGSHVLLEAGVRLHQALAPHIDRVWLSHSPTLVGDQHAAFGLHLNNFRLVARHLGEQFVFSRFECRQA